MCYGGGADGMQYLRDTCLTLCCFLQAYPSGAQLLSQGQAGMVTQLSSLHDDLLPTLVKTVASAKQQPLAQQVHPLVVCVPCQVCVQLWVLTACDIDSVLLKAKDCLCQCSRHWRSRCTLLSLSKTALLTQW